MDREKNRVDQMTMQIVYCELTGHTVRLKYLEMKDPGDGLTGVFECVTCKMQFKKIER